MSYAGQKKVGRDIEKRLKKEKSSNKSNDKKSKTSKLHYYAKLIYKNNMAQAKYITGELITINTPTLKKLIGKKVKYHLKKDIDRSGRGYISDPSFGIISEIMNKEIGFEDGNFYHFSQIVEMVLLD